MERERYIATVTGYTKLKKSQQKVVRPVVDDVQKYVLESAVIVENIINYDTKEPVPGVTKAFMYFENKEAQRNETRLFIGNTIAFDASIEMDNTVGMYRITRPKNFCGEAVEYVSFIEKETRKLITTKPIKWETCGDFGYCLCCKHYDNKTKQTKSSCAKNILV